MKINLVMSQSVIPQTDRPLLKVGLSLLKDTSDATSHNVEVNLLPEQILHKGLTIQTHPGAFVSGNRAFIPKLPRAASRHILLEFPIDEKLWSMIPHKALVLLSQLRITWQEVIEDNPRQLSFEKSIYVQKTNADIVPEENREIALLDEIISLRAIKQYPQKHRYHLPNYLLSGVTLEPKTRNVASNQKRKETIHPRFRFNKPGNNDSVV